jgi:HlyD family secretion protein
MSLSRFSSRWLAILSLIGIISGCDLNSLAQSQDATTEAKPKVQPSKQVVALGKLIPKGEVIKLSVANAEDSRVNQILVEEGDLVEKNQVIAVLQGMENRQRDLEAAEKEVELAQAKLNQVRAGESKQAEFSAQQANISRLESQLRNEAAERQAAIASAKAQLKQAQLTYDRNRSLQQQGAVSIQAFDQTKEGLDMAQASLNEKLAQLGNTQQTLKQEITQERQNLALLEEIRPVDVRVAEIEVEKAIIAVDKIKADLEDTKVKVPISGQILRINTRVGEQVNTEQGIVELGRTDEMYAIAEVYETDIGKVSIGQSATVSSEYGGFTGKLKGTVEHLGLQVGQKQLTESSEDPTQDENSRIVEVKVRINPEDSKKVAGLTNMQVRVEINSEH